MSKSLIRKLRYRGVGWLSKIGLRYHSQSLRIANFRLEDDRQLKLIEALSYNDAASLAVDVGAADGIFSSVFSALGYQCIAFEANPVVAHRLRRSLPSLHLEQIALSNEPGTTTLSVPVVGAREIYGFGSIQNGVANFDGALVTDLNKYEVAMATLDSFNLQDVGWIKIDVEGHEASVVAGAMSTISNFKPKMFIEVGGHDRNVDNSSLLDDLAEAGYAMFYYSDVGFKKYDKSNLSITTDVFCLPY